MKYVASLCRLSVVMTSLLVLVAVSDAAGSVSKGSTVFMVLGLSAALTNPLKARRWERSRSIGAMLVLTVVHIAAVGAAIATAENAWSLVFAVLAGAAQPPVVALIRARNLQPAGDARAMSQATGLEAVLTEGVWVAGPLLAGLLGVLLGHLGALAFALTLLLVSVYALCHLVVADLGHYEATRTDGAPAVETVLSGSMRVVLAMQFLASFVMGGVQVLILLKVDAAGGSSSLGPILVAIWASGSIAGGLVYATVLGRLQRGSLRHIALLVLQPTLLLLMVPETTTSMLTVAIFVIGLPAAAIQSDQLRMIALLSPASRRTVAFAVGQGFYSAGFATGSGAVGAAQGAFGSTGAVLLAALGGLACLVVGIVCFARLAVVLEPRAAV